MVVVVLVGVVVGGEREEVGVVSSNGSNSSCLLHIQQSRGNILRQLLVANLIDALFVRHENRMLNNVPNFCPWAL